MELGIAERLILLGILPNEGNFITLKILRQLREDLSFNEEEIEKYKIIQGDEQVQWNSEEDQKHKKDIKIGGEGTSIIVKLLKELDKTEKLNQKHLTLYEKFIEQ